MQDRVLPLDRVLNFRDFGGYETSDGARIVRGRLFRSAHFSEASDADMAKLDALGVSFIVDLRRPEERAHEPNRWPGEGVRTFRNEEGHAGALPPHLMALLQGDLTAVSVANYMRDLYRDFAFEQRHIELYRAWFAELALADGPAIIHCAAGKDRTGLGCALTLHALGVDEETIFADYELTNAVLDLDRRLPRIQERMEARLNRKLDPEALKPMLGVAPDYLRTALDAIEARHGAIDNYLEEVLGVGAGERAGLRKRLAA
ncbi:MAG: tyrosine-protein phosphatase [Terricaulis sp.]